MNFKQWGRRWVIFVVAAALPLAVWAAVRRLPAAEPRPEIPDMPAGMGSNLGEAPGSGGESMGVQIRPDTVVVRRTRYQDCAEVLEESGPPAPILVGFNLEALRRYYPQWQVAEFTAGRVVLQRQSGEPCPQAAAGRLVKLDEDGVVRVYYGSRVAPGVLAWTTDITAGRLVAGDRVRLTEGVELADDAAVRQFLEMEHR